MSPHLPVQPRGPFVSQTICPASSPVTLLRRVTDSPCDSTARVTPPSPSSPPSTGAARRRRARPTRTLRSGPTTAAAPLLLPYRCVLQRGPYTSFPFTLTGSHVFGWGVRQCSLIHWPGFFFSFLHPYVLQFFGGTHPPKYS